MLGETPDVRFIIHISNLIDVKNEFIEFKSLTKERGMKLNSPQTTHPYYNIANEFFEQDGILENDFDELISKLHSNFLPDNKISGSKILMSPIEQGEKFEKHFKNISSLKNVKFLFLTRDVNQTFKSMQKVKWPNTLEQVVQEMGVFHEVSSKYDNIFKIDYSDIISKNDNFKEMFNFIGVEYDENKINSALKDKCSY